jgi:DNA-binding MarR family transcriptional regulator
MSSFQSMSPAARQELYAALGAMGRGIDFVHSSGLLAERSGVRVDRGLHPVLATLSLQGRLRTTELATALALKSSTISRHVARLEELGLVARSADPDDGRSSWIELSAEGKATLDAIRDTWEQLLAERVANAGLANPETFAADLTRFGSSLQELPVNGTGRRRRG